MTRLTVAIEGVIARRVARRVRAIRLAADPCEGFLVYFAHGPLREDGTY